MDVVTLVGVVAALFIVISLSEPLADWSRLPYTVVLAIIGTLIGTGAAYLAEYGQIVTELAPAVDIFDFSIRANVFLYVLLPTLLFQVALGLNLRRMAEDWVPILVMAVVAVVLATFAIRTRVAALHHLAFSCLPHARRYRSDDGSLLQWSRSSATSRPRSALHALSRARAF